MQLHCLVPFLPPLLLLLGSFITYFKYFIFLFYCLQLCLKFHYSFVTSLQLITISFTLFIKRRIGMLMMYMTLLLKINFLFHQRIFHLFNLFSNLIILFLQISNLLQQINILPLQFKTFLLNLLILFLQHLLLIINHLTSLFQSINQSTYLIPLSSHLIKLLLKYINQK